MITGNPPMFGVGQAQALTDAATITLRLDQSAGAIAPSLVAQVGMGQYFTVTLGGNRNLDIYGMVDGEIIYLRVTQDGTGSRTLTPRLAGVASTVLTSGTPLTATAAAIDVVAIQFDAAAGKLLYYPVAKAFA